MDVPTAAAEGELATRSDALHRVASGFGVPPALPVSGERLYGVHCQFQGLLPCAVTVRRADTVCRVPCPVSMSRQGRACACVRRVVAWCPSPHVRESPVWAIRVCEHELPYMGAFRRAEL